MSMLRVNSALANEYSYADKMRKAAISGVDFMEQLQRAGEAESTSRLEVYQKYLKQRYGAVMIQAVGKDQNSMDKLGAGTAGTGNVVIAPNILEEMENDPEKASYYEEKIQHYFHSLPGVKAQISAMGHEIHSSGIVIHPDGTVTHYISGDLKPEVKRKIEARMKAEDEAKAKRRKRYRELSAEAAKKRRQETEFAYKRQNITELLTNYTSGMNQTIYVDASEVMSSVATAYEMNYMDASNISE